ncbi:hypothetical protein NW249_23975 [Streptomyces sp. OUCMDZ-4982]|uniref:hypothetical protein n=1 Tax=Streptomyces sp. OUCMDZ-4982 TaxID=2973090 RepID=UPI00215BD93A|nr:hypothetical protein [Streptomyces sp. OUCMDZ-4982]MCR8945179.1 hypothetical protein [Streptomyces sp. OUCMDZ-4982]
MKKLAALLLALVALLGMLAPAPAAAADEEGMLKKGVEYTCRAAAASNTVGLIVKAGADQVAGGDVCEKAAEKAAEKMEEWWEAVWDSIIGDLLRSWMDGAKWILQTMLTIALKGPSLDLEDTGLFGRDASLGGMLVWLGWVIVAFGAMWQIGKAAVTGQGKYWVEFLRGYAQNAMLSAFGLTVVGLLLQLGDAVSEGLLKATFDDDEGIERVLAVMVPMAVSNPVLFGGIALVLTLVGFMQLILIYLRQSAIPIQCLLLPVAGAGLLGGKATQSWAPKLITSICAVITYKPLVTFIICAGFAELGGASGVVEWLRGLTSLLLAVLAPGPLLKLFAPFGAELGGGMAAGGALGGVLGMAAKAGGSALGDSGSGGAGGSGGDAGGQGAPGKDSSDSQEGDPVRQARDLEQSMGPQSNGGASQGGGVPVPGQGMGPEAAGTVNGSAAAGAGAGTSTATAAAGSGAAAAAPGVGLALQVMDGVNDAVQDAASEIGDGGAK